MEWNFQRIEYFLKAAEEKSLSEAARKMFFTPQALNKNLRQLESELGIKLINRECGALGSGEKMNLTLAGEQLRDIFMPCYLEYERAVTEMEAYINHRKRKLRIAYFRGIKKDDFLMPLFQYLRNSGQFESIELIGGELGDVLEWISGEFCDVGLTNIHEKERKRKELQYTPIKTVPAKILISENHIWADKQCVTVQDMAEEEMVAIQWNEELEKESFYKNVRVREVKMVPDLDTMLTEIQTGKYFGVISAEFEGDYNKSYRLLDLPKEDAFVFVTNIIYRQGTCFQELFRKMIAEQAVIFAK